MADDPTEKKTPPGGADAEWLLQFYSASKSTDQVDDAPSQPLPDFAISPSEKYRVGDEIGSGGMKSVLHVYERTTERNVAMAVLRDPSVRWKKMARFVREARITAALEHPNIVPIYDIGLDGAGKPYFTMKLLGGETLQSILQRVHAGYGDYRARYPLSSLLLIFRGICNAIGFAHSRGVIHLDLKPANIQVGDFGEVLVLDWGLARVLEKDPILFPNRLVIDQKLREIQSEGVSGTPAFMSPEQARGENDTLDERTDIFALGAILHTILNCRKFPEKNGRRTRPENTKIPAALEAVATKAMANLPDERYQTVEELALDVRAYVDGYATAAQRAGALTLLVLLLKRHSVVAALVTISLAAVFAILTASLLKIRHSEQVALNALDKIKAEQAGKHQLGLLAAPQLIQRANDAIYALDYDKALSLLEETVALDPSSEEAWWNIAAIHLGRWEFDAAERALAHVRKSDFTANSKPVDMQGVCAKYSAISPEQNGSAPKKVLDAFAHDLIDANHDSWPTRRLALGVFFKGHNRSPQTVDFDLLEKSLRWLNPDAKDLVLTHENTPEGLKVSLHGRSINEICPLAGLPISILDCSGTGNVGVEWLRDAPLISVDFSRSDTRGIRMLDQWPTIQEMRLIDWQDRDFTQLGGFRHLKRVVVAPNDVNAAGAAVKDLPIPPEIVLE